MADCSSASSARDTAFTLVLLENVGRCTEEREPPGDIICSPLYKSVGRGGLCWDVNDRGIRVGEKCV